MEEQNQVNLTQQDVDRIVKKNSAKYLKKLEEKDNEIAKYKEVIDNIGEVYANKTESYSPEDEKQEQPEVTDVITAVEDILKIPPKQRTAEQDELLERLNEDYKSKLFDRDLEETRQWAAENLDSDADELINSDEFAEFAKDINAPLPNIFKKYVQYVKKPVVKPTATPGSVKDTSGTAEKQYFSRDEVEKMSAADIKKYMPIIKKSMPKW